MRTRKLLFIILVATMLFNWHGANAQFEQKAFLGFGAGLDYGGLGLRGEYMANKAIGVFAGFGYNLADPAFNAGLSIKVLPGKKVVPVLTAMYGYNAVIKLKYDNGTSEGTSYYGPSVGVGCEFYDRSGRNKWLLEMFVPFRNSDFHNRYDELRDSGVEFNPDILPVTFTVGYNFSISSKNRE
jgi:hypothetical protein